MQIRQDKDYINSLIDPAKNIAIVSARHGTDGVAAAIGLAEYINDKYGKNSTVIYPFDQGEFDNELLMIRNVNNDMGTVALKISLDYSGTAIESVDYHKEDESKLILEIGPVDRDFDMSRIKYEIDGTDYDLIITVGASTLASLGAFYSRNKSEFDKTDIINIDNSVNNENFGKINIVNPAALNLSALVLAKFGEWEYTPGKLAAKSLLLGLNS
jgi:hypothetical protein